MATLRTTRSGTTPQPTSTAGRRAQRGASQAANKAATLDSEVPRVGPLTRQDVPPANLATTDPALLDPIDESFVASPPPAPTVGEVEEVEGDGVAQGQAQAPTTQQSVIEAEQPSAAALLDGIDDHVLPLPGLPGPSSPGGQSVASGTTANTTFSVVARQELALRKDELLEMLPEMVGDANTILRMLAPMAGSERGTIEKALMQVLHEPGKKLDKLHRVHADFEDQFLQFTYNRPFLDRDILLQSILDVTILDVLSAGPGRPDDLLYKANLAELMFKIVVELDIDHRPMFLQELDDHFPTPFLAKLGGDAITPGGSFAANLCFETAAAIKTQLLISRLQAEANADPFSIVCQVFGLYPEDPLHGSVRQWNDQLFMQVEGSLQGEYERIIKDKVRGMLFDEHPTRGVTFDYTVLRETNTWHDFVTDMGVWASSRNLELEQNISKKGGPDMIIEQLRLGNYKRAKPTAASARALTSIKQRRRRTKNNPNTPGCIFGAVDGEKDDPSSDLPRQRFLDAQPGAMAVPFDSQTPRQTQELMGEVTQDDGFRHDADAPRGYRAAQMDPNVLPLAKRPAEAAMLQPGDVEVGAAPAKRRRGRQSKAAQAAAAAAVAVSHVDLDNNLFAQEEEEEGAGLPGGTEQRGGGEHGDEDDDDDDDDVDGLKGPRLTGLPPSTGFQSHVKTARKNTADEDPHKEPQKRKAWTQEETDALLWYCERYGSKWSEIMRADNGLHFSDRGQVALKDKARNLIRTAWKSGQPIPKGLENYNLPENMKQELRAQGHDI